MHTVADSQDWNTEVPEGRVDVGRVGSIDRVGRSRQDDTLWLKRKRRHGHGAREQFAVDAYTPGSINRWLYPAL